MASTPYRPPEHRGLSLLHVSEHWIVVDKPSGLLSVPGRGEGKEDCLVRRVQVEFPEAMIVHRLDMGPSGVVVMGRGARAQRALSGSFEQRRVQKRYQALVDGCWTRDAVGEIALPIARDPASPARRRVDPASGRPSLTRYRVIDAGPAQSATRVQLEPVTGRTHQLRVHMEAIGHPVLGDDFYGTPASCAMAERLMLHACEIELDCPLTGAGLRFACPPPF